MHGNHYEAVIEPWKVKLIAARAMRMGFRVDEIEDLQQRIVPALAAYEYDPHREAGATELTVAITIIDRQLSEVRRGTTREQRRMEHVREDRVAGQRRLQQARRPDETHLMVMDVRDAVGKLPPRLQQVCRALQEGLSRRQIAEVITCTVHEVRSMINDIRARFERIGLAGWVAEVAND